MKKIAKRSALFNRQGWLIVGALVIIGVAIVIASRAATPTANLEAEDGAATTNARAISDTLASGGQAIKFSGSGQSSPKCNQLTNLKLCDDFDAAANTAPDSTKWNVLTGSSWGGHCFRNARENIAADGQGNMKFTLIDKGTTQCTDSTGNPTSVTSGGMDTSGKGYYHYGKYEIRAKISCAKSVWGSIWMSTGTGPSWPQSGEIDLYEIIGTQQNKLQQTLWAGNPKWHIPTYYTIAQPLCQDFHTYGMEWREGYIQFTLDGVNTNRIRRDVEAAGKPWPFDTYDLRMLIDLQYGGVGWPSQGPYDLSELPSSMLVDYVRIFN